MGLNRFKAWNILELGDCELTTMIPGNCERLHSKDRVDSFYPEPEESLSQGHVHSGFFGTGFLSRG